VDAVIAESDCVDVWNLPNRVILASLPDPAVIQMMLVDRERRLLTIRNMPPENKLDHSVFNIGSWSSAEYLFEGLQDSLYKRCWFSIFRLAF
jgi:hypothetical protein